jgi:multidrug efflux system membrane fusion protein
MKRPDEDFTGGTRRETAERGVSDAPAVRSRSNGWLWILACLFVAGAAGWWFLGRNPASAPAAAQQRGVPVEVAAIRKADVPIYLRGLGTIQAYNIVLVRSRVDGTITRIAFQEGQMVKEGDVLATIDPRSYQAALDQAIAKKAQDEATLRSNRLDLARTQQLASRDFASRQQFDQQTAQVAAQESVVRADQAAIDNARTQLDYTTIRSPLTGRLGLRLIDQGNIVRASDTTGIVEVAQLQPISLIFTAPEGQLGPIRDALGEGDVEVAALASQTGARLGLGKLSLVNNTVDAASGTVRLKGVFPNEDNALWPGLSVNTRLKLKTITGALVVPEDAVMRSQDGLFVFVVSGEDKVEKRRVEIGAFSEGMAVVKDGVKEGDRVVTAGQSRLQPGTKVEVREPQKEGQTKAEAAPSTGERRAP